MLGCAPILPPDLLGDVDRARVAPATIDAKEHAPDAYAVAEKLRTDAYAAFESGDLAGSKIIAEQAMAAYAQAVAQARVSRAEEVRVEMVSARDAAERRLAELDVQLQQLAAELHTQERRLEVLQNIEPTAASKSATGNREQARAAAVVTLHREAHLLCAAATLLSRSLASSGPHTPPPQLEAARTALGEIDALLADKPRAAPIDQARRVRASCLGALTMVRRSRAAKGSAGSADAMLASLSQLGHGELRRDERGLVVTLRNLFEGDRVGEDGSAALKAIAAVAVSHQSFPVMVVVHDGRTLSPRGKASSKARGRAVVAVLRDQLGVARVTEAEVAGTTIPVVDPAGKHVARNERIDVVFVAPSAR